MGCCGCCDDEQDGPSSPRAEQLNSLLQQCVGSLREFVARILQYWEGDNEHGDNEQGDNEHGDNEQCDIEWCDCDNEQCDTEWCDCDNEQCDTEWCDCDNEHGDNEQCDIEWCDCDNEHGDNEQGDDDHIYEQKVQILVESGFAEDDVRGALNENGCNEFLALLMLCAQNTNTK